MTGAIGKGHDVPERVGIARIEIPNVRYRTRHTTDREQAGTRRYTY